MLAGGGGGAGRGRHFSMRDTVKDSSIMPSSSSFGLLSICVIAEFYSDKALAQRATEEGHFKTHVL